MQVALMHRLFGIVFPCCELRSLITFRGCCFSPMFSPVLGLCKVAIIHCGVVAVEAPWFLGCCGVVSAMLGPRTTLSCLVGLSYVLPLFGTVTWLSLSSSQGCEGIVLLRYAVVGLQTIVSGIRGWVCMRILVLRPPAWHLAYTSSLKA